jgi:hypothetical protein
MERNFTCASEHVNASISKPTNKGDNLILKPLIDGLDYLVFNSQCILLFGEILFTYVCNTLAIAVRFTAGISAIAYSGASALNRTEIHIISLFSEFFPVR